MKEELCTVVENRRLEGRYYLLKIEAGYVSAASKPGNFVMLAASSTFEPLLKRPFGILKSEPPFIWIYYRVVGKGTKLISGLRQGDRLYILGPLGNSFPPFKGKNILMVAGGRGIAPIFYGMGNYSPENRVFLVYGAGSKGDLNLLDEMASLQLEDIFLYTEDGSLGKKGTVVSDIREIIGKYGIEATLSCGPDAMFKSVFEAIEDLGTENYVSLEALMGCGFGVCHSCVVLAADGTYKRVCKEGPVFRLEEIRW